MISRFIQTEVKVICRSEAEDKFDTMRKPNSIIVLLYIDKDAITVPAECRQFSMSL